MKYTKKALCRTRSILVFFYLSAFCCDAYDFDRSDYCTIPTLQGGDNSAFTGEIVRLIRDRNGYLTVQVRVTRILHGTNRLPTVLTVRNLHRSTSCGHTHRVGDDRVWLVKRHTSGHLTVVSSLSITAVNIRRVKEAFKGQ